MRGAPQVDEGKAVREGGSHSDRNTTVAIFYNGYTDGCSHAAAMQITPAVREQSMLHVTNARGHCDMRSRAYAVR